MNETVQVPKAITEAQADVLGVPAAFYAKLVQHAAMLATPQTFGVALGTICAGDVRFNAPRPEERRQEPVAWAVTDSVGNVSIFHCEYNAASYAARCDSEPVPLIPAPPMNVDRT